MLSAVMLAWTLTVSPTNNPQTQEMHLVGHAPSNALWVPIQIIVSQSSKDINSHCAFKYSLRDSENNIVADKKSVFFNGWQGNGPSTPRGIESLSDIAPYSVNSNLSLNYVAGNSPYCKNNDIRVDVLAYPIYPPNS